MRKSICLTVSLGLITAFGCRQGVNQNAPLLPIAPLGGQTRVPPPSTGSFAVPNQYYQGQASLSDGTDAASVASNMSGSPSSGSSMSTNTTALTEVNGDSMERDMTAVASSPMPAWTENSPRYSTSVQPASYVAEPTSNVAQSPSSALQLTAQTDTGLRPPLRGMPVLDLTSSGQLKPVTNADLQPISPPSTTSTMKADASQDSVSNGAAKTLNWRKPY